MIFFSVEMPFPDAPRVIYQENPLVEVICQLRFPTILEISASEPALFREQYANSFPYMKGKPALRLWVCHCCPIYRR